MGELIFGIVLGNLSLLGVTAFGFVNTDAFLKVLSDFGAILLLFYVGLESRVEDLLKVGASALLVACLGVVAPWFLGWGVSKWLHPGAHPLSHIFVGAILCATSVGITARVLGDLESLHLPEARIVLGAAVIDDVLGLLVIAVVSGLIRSADTGQTLEAGPVLLIAGKAVVFVAGATVVGRLLAPHLFRLSAHLPPESGALTVGLALCLTFAWLAHLAGLAYIVGAFVAGLVVEEKQFRLSQRRV